MQHYTFILALNLDLRLEIRRSVKLVIGSPAFWKELLSYKTATHPLIQSYRI